MKAHLLILAALLTMLAHAQPFPPTPNLNELMAAVAKDRKLHAPCYAESPTRQQLPAVMQIARPWSCRCSTSRGRSGEIPFRRSAGHIPRWPGEPSFARCASNQATHPNCWPAAATSRKSPPLRTDVRRSVHAQGRVHLEKAARPVDEPTAQGHPTRPRRPGTPRPTNSHRPLLDWAEKYLRHEDRPTTGPIDTSPAMRHPIDLDYVSKAIVGIASPVVGVITSFQEQIEWHLRVASLLWAWPWASCRSWRWCGSGGGGESRRTVIALAVFLLVFVLLWGFMESAFLSPARQSMAYYHAHNLLSSGQLPWLARLYPSATVLRSIPAINP